MIVVIAGVAGPSGLQRQFFRGMITNLAAYEAKGRAFVDRYRSDDAELSIYSLEIGNDAEVSAGEFTIEYTDAQGDIIHRAEFFDFEPRNYGADD